MRDEIFLNPHEILWKIDIEKLQKILDDLKDLLKEQELINERDKEKIKELMRAVKILKS